MGISTRSLRLPDTWWWTRLGPYCIALVWLVAGYLHYEPGTAFSLSADHYRDWAFPAFRYSDIIWLYLRDNLSARPAPYLDFPLEYPPLTGLLSWLLSWAPDLPTYFTGSYVVLAGGALATIWALQRLPGANAWLFTMSPALYFYTGHQWDLAAIATTALSLLALQRDRRAIGVIGLALGTSLKLFPVVFFAAVVIESLRNRKWLQGLREAALFASITTLVNLPVAAANRDGWSFFIRWNRDRLADSGLWVLWRDFPTTDLTRWSLVAALAGFAALTILGLRQRGPLTIPLGSTYLVWWLLVNKTFTTHLMLWVILALALLSAPVWLWLLTTAVDVLGFQLGNFLNLYNVDAYQNAPLTHMAVVQMYDPLQLARTFVLGANAVWMVQLLSDFRRRSAFNSYDKSACRLQADCFPPLFADSLSTRERRFGAVVAILIFSVATLFMTWPYAVRAGNTTAVGFDPLLQIWLSEWIQHALVTDPAALFSANMFYPFAQTLAYTDANIPGALAAIPIRALTGDPILTNSLLVLLSFVASGLGVFALVRTITGNQAVAVLTGLAYAFLPYRMVHLWHLNWLEGALIPWFLVALLWLHNRPTASRAVVTGCLAAGITLVSFYFALQLAVIALAVSTGVWISRRAWPDSRFWRLSALATGVALGIAMPFLFPYLQVHREQRLERTLEDAEQYKAMASSYVQLAPWTPPNALHQALGVRAAPNKSLSEVGQAIHADGHQHPEIVSEDALYPGLVIIVFSAVALMWRRTRWLVFSLLGIAAVAAILSLGPSWGPRQGNNPLLPYAWLYDHLPFFRAMRVPARLGGLVDLALVTLAALGMDVAWTQGRRFVRRDLQHVTGLAVTTVVGFLILADVWSGPVPLENVDRSPVAMSGAFWLASQPPGPVMEFPAESIFADPAAASVRRHSGESVFRSTIHWLPMVNGNSGFIPRAYSEFIERFVGTLPGPDGASTGRLSHLNLQTVKLLQQLDVRYAVFNVDQYAPDDWTIVERELSALVSSGDLAAAGLHGAQQVYVVTPAQPGPPAPRVYLFAPTLMTPDDVWSPWIGIETSITPSILSLTKPAHLTLRWYDDAGRLLRSIDESPPLPVIVDEAALLCSVRVCLTSRPFTDVRRLPRPDRAGSWMPGAPGHFTVKAQLSGDTPMTCQIDLDIVDDAVTVTERGGDDPFRWAVCVQDSQYPVNNPGLPPVSRGATKVTLSTGAIGVEFSATARHDDQLRAWFILSPRGLPEPWRVAAYKSPTEERMVHAGEPAAFAWSVPVTDSLAPGAYDLSIWVHHQTDTGWRHATGGLATSEAMLLDADGTLRRAGPIFLNLGDSVVSLTRGETSTLPVQIKGQNASTKCSVRWEIALADEPETVRGETDCESISIALPAGTPLGRHLLTLNVYADSGTGQKLSDGVTRTITVIDSPVEPPR